MLTAPDIMILLLSPTVKKFPEKTSIYRAFSLLSIKKIGYNNTSGRGDFVMACIVYRTNKETGVVYAYRSESYRDPVNKKPRNKRTYLGRVDPETKQIVPKAEAGKRNRSKLGPKQPENVMAPDVADVLARQRQEIEELNQEISILKEQMNSMRINAAKIHDMLAHSFDL